MITDTIKCLAEELLQEGLEDDNTPSEVMTLIEELREEIFTESNRERENAKAPSDAEKTSDSPEQEANGTDDVTKLWSDLMNDQPILTFEPNEDKTMNDVDKMELAFANTINYAIGLHDASDLFIQRAKITLESYSDS